jgi:predicted ATPase
VADQFADGAWFVDLVPVTDPAMIAPAIAAALGLGEHHSRSAEDTVLGWLADRETLLMLDNCEHLLSGVVGLLERLLAGCAGLSVLATSRAPRRPDTSATRLCGFIVRRSTLHYARATEPPRRGVSPEQPS